MTERAATETDMRVEEVIAAIRSYDATAIIRVTKDTYEGEDVYLYVHTDRDSVDLLRHVAEVTVRLSEEQGFHAIVLPMGKSEAEGVV